MNIRRCIYSCKNYWRRIQQPQLPSLVLGLLVMSFGVLQSRNSFADETVNWQNIKPGFDYARIPLSGSDSFLTSEIAAVRVSPKNFHVEVVTGADVGAQASDVKTFAKKVGGVAAINANFFDENGKPLGLVIARGRRLGALHSGGNVLSGIFCVREEIPSIVPRRLFDSEKVSYAIQSGPRLIENGKPLKLRSPHVPSRRSVIAITNSGEILLLSTMLRFPGATLEEIQNLLLRSELGVKNALNLDGGGSSQLYIEPNAVLKQGLFVSGGDRIPVGLVITESKNNSL